MRTITLKIGDQVYDKLLWFLKKFSKDEVEIVSDDVHFAETRKYLEQELNEVREGNAKYVSIEELEKRLDDTIRKHEDRI